VTSVEKETPRLGDSELSGKDELGALQVQVLTWSSPSSKVRAFLSMMFKGAMLLDFVVRIMGLTLTSGKNRFVLVPTFCAHFDNLIVGVLD
jgi:hypothetical protein